MKVVVFTGNPDLADTPWWSALVETPGIEAILVCRKIQSSAPRDVFKRFRRNVARHGLIFIPYRIGLLAIGLLQRPFRRRQPHAAPPLLVIPVQEIEALDIHAPDILEQVRAFDPDLGASLGAPILKPVLFRIPRRGTINLHLGRVPDFRGAPPAFWEMVAGATSVGATVHWMDEGLDTGAILASGDAPIYPTDTLTDVEERAAELGTLLLKRTLDGLSRGDLPSRTQVAGGATNRMPTLRQRKALDWRLGFRRLRRRIAPRQLAKATAMVVALYLYRPLRDAVRTLRRRHPVRVFTFHRITSLCRDGMTIAPEPFVRQVRYLAKHHDILPLEQAVALVREGARLRRPVAVITFDDAYRSVFDVARPVLASSGIPACCFVSTDLVGTDRRFAHDADNPMQEYFPVMDWAQLTGLRALGWSVGNHTASHARLSECTGAQLQREVEEPRRALGQHLGVEPGILAYPFGRPGDISPEALEAARRAGHHTVFANHSGENVTGRAELLLGRFDLGGDHQPLAWKALAHGMHLGRWRDLWHT